MRAVVCRGPRDYVVEEVGDPTAGLDGAVLAVEAVGVCASDAKCFQGAPMFWGDDVRAPYVEAPVTPGHEFVGRIVELGADAAARWDVRVGDRVVVEQIVPCEECWYCNRGFYWMCRQNDIFGFHQAVQGAMAEFVRIPAKARVHKVSPDLTAAEAAFAEPLSCSLHAVDRAEIGFDDTVVIAGLGPIGLGMVAGARLKNPRRIICVDVDPVRLEVARACGADVTLDIADEDPVERVLDLTDGYGCDVYLDATGHPSGVVQGLTMLRKLGRFVEYSVMREPVSVDWTIIGDSKELDVRGAHLGPHSWPMAIRMIERGALPLDRIITHHLPITEVARALELVSGGRESIKVVLDSF
jgi:2-desacetyl-2-hydroxyethyl bacteriochlorophyllide A dehydrogenase